MTPDLIGQWSKVITMPGTARTTTIPNPNHRPTTEVEGIWPIHACLLHTGELLLFSGRLEGSRFRYEAAVWKPGSANFPPPASDPGTMSEADIDAYREAIPAPFDNDDPEEPSEWYNTAGEVDSSYEPGLDLFCCHQAHLEDGRILVMGGAGGHEPGDANGNPAVFIFDPSVSVPSGATPPPVGPYLEYWSRLPVDQQMDDGRWYPTSVTLPDGRVVAFSGRRRSGHWVNYDTEVFSPPSYSAKLVIGGEQSLHTYPSMHLVRGGKVFYTHTTWAYRNERPAVDATAPSHLSGTGLPTSSFKMNGHTTGVWENYTKSGSSALLTPTYPERKEAAAVLLPPASAGQILLIGGSRRSTEQYRDSAGNLKYAFNVDSDKRFEIAAEDVETTFPPWNVVGGGTLEPNTNGATWVYKDTGGTVVSDNVGRLMKTHRRRGSEYLFRHRVASGGTVQIGVEDFETNPPPWTVTEGGTLSPRADNRGYVWTDAGGTVVNEFMYRRVGAYFGITTASEPKAAEILHTKGLPGDATSTTPTWEDVGPMHHDRVNANLVILPDGKVLIAGGEAEYKGAGQGMTLETEIYDPRTKTFALGAPLTQGRQYHSTALLMPDGRVYAGGGSASGSGHTMEFYKPAYFFTEPMIPRLEILDILVEHASEKHVSYGENFTIQVADAAAVSSVVLIRPGAATHQIDSNQRLVVPYNMSRRINSGSEPDEIDVTVPFDASEAPPGWYMVWINDRFSRPCVEAKFIRITHRNCRIINNRSSFGKDETNTFLSAGERAIYERALYVHIDGFLPSELGIGTSLPTTESGIDTLDFSISLSGGTSGMDLTALEIQPEDTSLDPEIRQRFTVVYNIEFTSLNAFPDALTGPDSKDITATVRVDGHECQSTLRLLDQPNPYMIDGDTSWLSMDLRVFTVADDEEKFGERVMGSPNAYILKILDNLEMSAHDFEDLRPEQGQSKLSLARVNGENKPVWNFAVAQVRYRGSSGNNAMGVKCFFRAFQTAVTNMTYDRNTTYRSFPIGGDPNVPVLGLSADNHITTIPFFAHPRQGDMEMQTVKENDFMGTGGDTIKYFGCWLDINQPTDLRFPEQLASDTDFGPYSVRPQHPLLSVQDLIIRGAHQCLVAELVFQNQVHPGDTPGSSDKLAQRNLAYLPSDNPGGPSSRIVNHTCDFKPVVQGNYLRSLTQNTFLAPNIDVALFPQRKPRLVPSKIYDELQFHWGNVPRDAEVELYLPNADLDTMLELHDLRYGPKILERVGPDRVKLLVEGTTHLPLVSSQPINIAGLVTLRLPPGITVGDEYELLVEQISGVKREVVGSFEIKIPVGKAVDVLPGVSNTYSVLKKVGNSIKPADRWFPVFQAYLLGVGNQIRGLGGVPEFVPPSGDGWTHNPESISCRNVGWLVTLLLAVTLILLGFESRRFAIGAAVATLVVLGLWKAVCRPKKCTIIHRILSGAGLATGVLGLIAIFSTASKTLVTALGISAVITVLFILLAYLFNCCFSLRQKDEFDQEPFEEEQPELRSEREKREHLEREILLTEKRKKVDALPNISGEADIQDEPHTHPPGPRRDHDHHPNGDEHH